MSAHQIATDNSVFLCIITKILSHKTDFLTLLVSFLSLVVSAMSWRATNGQMKIAENQYKISLYEKRMERFESYCNKVQEVASILDQPLATTALKDILHDCMRVFYSQFEKDSPIGIAIDACMTYDTMNLLYKRKCFSYQEREREIGDINNIAKITKEKEQSMARDLDCLSQEIKSIGDILMEKYNEYQIQILNAREWMHEQLYVPDAPSYKPAVLRNFINKIKMKAKFLRKN